jgi:mono/diheme cytochrome c family protein
MAAAILATIVAAVILVRVAPTGRPPTASQSTLATDDRPRNPGVLATVRAGETSVERRLPALAFALEPGQSLDARVPAGPFEARFDVTFHPGSVRRARVGADMSGGTLSIERAGQPVATTTDPEGRVTSNLLYFPDRTSTLTYTFRADGEGPVLLRALWQPDIASAPMPFPAQGGEWARDTEVTGLGAIGARARPSWIRQWVTRPHDLKPGTRMPALLRDPGDDETVEDLVHFLASLGGPIEEPDHELDDNLVNTGEALFHTVGCFACHEATALGPLGDKTTPGALAAFLLDPVSVRPSGRMPAQRLTELEAEAIASYLIAANQGTSSGREPFTPDPTRVERGRAAFSARGCAACHTLGPRQPTIASTLAAPGLESIAPRDLAGCLSAEPVAGAPHFDLHDAERVTLAAFLRALPDRVCQDVPIDRLGATLVRLVPDGRRDRCR